MDKTDSTLILAPPLLPKTSSNIAYSPSSSKSPKRDEPHLPSYHDAITCNSLPSISLNHGQPPTYTPTPRSNPPQPQTRAILPAMASLQTFPISYCDDEHPFINEPDRHEGPPPSYYSLFTRHQEQLRRVIREYDGFNGPADTAEAVFKWFVMLVIIALIIAAVGTSQGWGKK